MKQATFNERFAIGIRDRKSSNVSRVGMVLFRAFRRSLFAIAASSLLAASVTRSDAEIVTYNFKGFDPVQSFVINGSFSFDSAAPNISGDGTGVYTAATAVSWLVTDVDGIKTVDSAALSTLGKNFIGIVNDDLVLPGDSFQVYAAEALKGGRTFDLNLVDSAGSMLGGIELPSFHEFDLKSGSAAGSILVSDAMTKGGRKYTVTSVVRAGAAPLDPTEELKAKIAALEKEMATITTERDQAQADLLAAQGEVKKLSDQIVVMKVENFVLQGKIDQLAAQNAQLTAKIDQLNGQITQLTTQNAQLTAQIDQLNGQVAQLTTQNAQLTSQVNAVQSAVQSLTQSFQVAFKNPAFVIPGATPEAQTQNLIIAIQALSNGQQKALFTNLGGKEGKGKDEGKKEDDKGEKSDDKKDDSGNKNGGKSDGKKG